MVNQGDRVDFDEVINYLADVYTKRERNIELFELFCRPVQKARFKDLYALLIKERRIDEQRG